MQVKCEFCFCQSYAVHVFPFVKMCLNDMMFFTNRTNRLEIAFVSWPTVRYKREVLFGWVDLLGKYI